MSKTGRVDIGINNTNKKKDTTNTVDEISKVDSGNNNIIKKNIDTSITGTVDVTNATDIASSC